MSTNTNLQEHRVALWAHLVSESSGILFIISTRHGILRLNIQYLNIVGADELLLCGSDCAEEAEKAYDHELKDSYDKDCKKNCAEDDDECEKACKEAEKDAKNDAEDAAEDKYEKCNEKCFKVESVFKFDLASAFKVRYCMKVWVASLQSESGRNLQSFCNLLQSYLKSTEDTLEKCIEKCGKFADKSGKIAECQTDCYASYPTTRSVTLTSE